MRLQAHCIRDQNERRQLPKLRYHSDARVGDEQPVQASTRCPATTSYFTVGTNGEKKRKGFSQRWNPRAAGATTAASAAQCVPRCSEKPLPPESKPHLCTALRSKSVQETHSLSSLREHQFAEGVTAAAADWVKDSFDSSGLSACVEGDDP